MIDDCYEPIGDETLFGVPVDKLPEPDPERNFFDEQQDEEFYGCENYDGPDTECCRGCPEYPNCDPVECGAWCAEVQNNQ